MFQIGKDNCIEAHRSGSAAQDNRLVHPFNSQQGSKQPTHEQTQPHSDENAGKHWTELNQVWLKDESQGNHHQGKGGIANQGQKILADLRNLPADQADGEPRGGAV